MNNPEKFFSDLSSLNETEILSLIDSSQEYQAEDLKKFLDYIYQISPPLDLTMKLYDCCGTGGDQTNTFNISTATAIVAAACNVRVSKNGGRSASSTVGSVDVLEALGLNLEASLESKIQGLEKNNLAFFSSKVSAELLAPIKQVCRKYKRSSFISLLAPIASPVKLEAQLIGVGRESWVATMIESAQLLIKSGLRKRVILVHSKVFNSDKCLDELSTCSSSRIIEINSQGIQNFNLKPQDLDIKESLLDDLQGGENAAENAQIILDLLNPRSLQGAQRRSNLCSTVALNVALLLYLANSETVSSNDEFLSKMRMYFLKAEDVIKKGRASSNLELLIELYAKSSSSSLQ